MKVSTTLTTIIALWLLLASQPARSEDCSSPALNTYEHADCEQRNEAAAEHKLDAALHRTLKAATALLKISVVDFRPQIEQAQMLWTRWAAAECALEADAIMGSASAFALHICRRELDEERTRLLNDLAEQLEGLMP